MTKPTSPPAEVVELNNELCALLNRYNDRVDQFGVITCLMTMAWLAAKGKGSDDDAIDLLIRHLNLLLHSVTRLEVHERQPKH